MKDHAPLTLRFKNLKGELPYDGTAELCWDSYENSAAGRGAWGVEPPKTIFIFVSDAPQGNLAAPSLEEMQEDFDSPEANAAVADADTFTVVRAHIYTREYILQ